MTEAIHVIMEISIIAQGDGFETPIISHLNRSSDVLSQKTLLGLMLVVQIKRKGFILSYRRIMET